MAHRNYLTLPQRLCTPAFLMLEKAFEHLLIARRALMSGGMCCANAQTGHLFLQKSHMETHVSVCHEFSTPRAHIRLYF